MNTINLSEIAFGHNGTKVVIDEKKLVEDGARLLRYRVENTMPQPLL